MPIKDRYQRQKASGKKLTPEQRAKAVVATKRWRDNNPERHAAHMIATRIKLKLEVIAGYGGSCTCCGETHPDFLSLQHIEGGGRVHRKLRGTYGAYRDVVRAGFPCLYTILCMNCNHARRYNRACPHKTHGNVKDDLVKALEGLRGVMLATCPTAQAKTAALADANAALAKVAA